MAKWADWPLERLCKCIANSVAYLDRLWSYPPAWKALLAVARFLPHEGCAEGNDCWEVYSDALEQASMSMMVAA